MLPVWGADINGGAYTWRGLFLEFYGILANVVCCLRTTPNKLKQAIYAGCCTSPMLLDNTFATNCYCAVVLYLPY